MTREPAFLAPNALREGGPRRFGIQIERLLTHLGFDDVRGIDGAGDGGGDVLAALHHELFVFQNKWTSGETIGADGVNEVERAKALYSADRAVLVTNAELSPSALKRVAQLGSVGVTIEHWNGADLAELFGAIPDRTPAGLVVRDYQSEAISALETSLTSRRRALLVLATGLGKTVIGGELIASYLRKHPGQMVLVVAHLKELVQQLERALWRHLGKTTRTHLLTGDFKPQALDGVTCATVESALGAAYDGYRPGLVMVDETHHVGESGQFQRLLDLLDGQQQFGVTATPWRGDGYDISQRFGAPSFRMGIAEGMSRGFLAQVDYELLVDNIDWDLVRTTSQQGLSIKDLNSKLFLPQRDEAFIARLQEAWSRTSNPRAIVFCKTIEHANRVAELLARSSPDWRRAASMHSRRTTRDRNHLMLQFRLGRVPIVTAVDILNEGVDIPDVNIIGFLRVTHSRRIFVQQLGRGLRLREGKERVAVLDFVTDIRRVAAVLGLKRSLHALSAEAEAVVLPEHSSISFSNLAVGGLMDAWIQDAADLETAFDDTVLQFPNIPNSIE